MFSGRETHLIKIIVVLYCTVQCSVKQDRQDVFELSLLQPIPCGCRGVIIPVIEDNRFSKADAFQKPRPIFHHNDQNVRSNELKRIGFKLKARTDAGVVKGSRGNQEALHLDRKEWRRRCRQRCNWLARSVHAYLPSVWVWKCTHPDPWCKHKRFYWDLRRYFLEPGILSFLSRQAHFEPADWALQVVSDFTRNRICYTS